MKRLEKTMNKRNEVIGMYANLPDTVGVHEDDAPINSHSFRVEMADGRHPTKPHQPRAIFDLVEDHLGGRESSQQSESKIEGFASDGLPDPAEFAMWCALTTKMRDNLAAAQGFTQGTYEVPQDLVDYRDEQARKKAAEEARAAAAKAAQAKAAAAKK